MRLKRGGAGLAAAVMALGAVGAAEARPGEIAPDLSVKYDKIAEFGVRDGRDRDVAEPPAGERYSEARFCVSFTSVEFRKVEVAFAGSEAAENLRVRRLIRSGDCSRGISLLDDQGEPRALDQIKFDYTAYVKRGLQPLVTVYLR